MGVARQKRIAEEQRRAAEQRRRAEERAKWNAPKGRRGYRGMELRVMDPNKPGLELGRFQLHPDGKVYTVGSPARRVKDPAILGLVYARYHELHPPVPSGETA